MKRIIFTVIAVAGILILAGCPTPNDPTPTAVTFVSAVQTGGTSGTADSTGLTLTFSVDPTSLAASDITVTGATKGTLSGTGTIRMLAISDITVANGGTVEVAIASPSGFTISGSPKTAGVYRLLYAIGDTGPSGVGIVFYITEGGLHGMEAAPSDQSASQVWIEGGSTQSTLNDDTTTDIGSGSANTDAIIGQTDHTGSAAQVCRDYNGGGLLDWFLPSKDELNQLYLHKDTIGGFSAIDYWSSSEYFSSLSWIQHFGPSGFQDFSAKGDIFHVRAIRAF